MIQKKEEKEVENSENQDLLPRPASEILDQISEEIDISRQFVKPKRDEFRNRLRLYNNQRKQREKIGDTTLYNIMNTLLAVYYTDELDISFAGREIGDMELATNIQNTAKFDYEEMGMDEINYMTQWDRFFFGVGIRQLSEWNENRKTPVVKSLDALSWLPDPAGYMALKNFRFMGFEVEYSKEEMESNEGFFNVAQLKPTDSQGSEKDITNAELRTAQGLNNNPYKEVARKEGNIYNMVEWYTSIEGDDGVCRKYLCTVDDNVKTLVRCEELAIVTAEEKEDPSLVPFPIALNYYSPTRSDPFGVSVCDLVEDKQRAKSILKNLKLAAVRASIYPMYLYNKDKITNRRDLDFSFNKFIGVRGDVNDGAIQPLNKAPTRFMETLNEEQAIDKDVEIATGADKVSQGVTSSTQRTLGEIEQVQANASIRFLLGSRINAWGEKRLWKLWYRMYKQNFSQASEKIIRLQSAIGTKYYKITRKDFITTEDPDIIIGSKLEIERKRQEEKIAYSAILPMLQADTSKPLASKRFAERRMLKLYGVPQEEINIISPETPDESRARMENELLSRDKTVGIEMEQDHLSHNIIHSQAEDTDARNAHINLHKRAYYASGEAALDKANEAPAPGTNPMANMANAATNQIGNMNAQNNAKPMGGTVPIGT